MMRAGRVPFAILRLSLLGAILSAAPVLARDYNYQDIPMGERAFGMGSVSMALDGDVGNIFFNPATLSRETSGQVSAALNAYTRIDSRSGEYISLFDSMAQNVSKGGFVPIPSMVGGNLKAGEWTWGGAILVPFSYRASGELKESNDNIVSFEGAQEDVWLGAFAARRYGDWDFGVSIFYASRSSDEKFFFIQKNPATAVTDVRFYNSSMSVNGLLAVLGATYEVSEDFRLGFSARPPVWALAGTANISDAKNGSTTEGRFQEAKYKTFPMPARLSVGMSYRFSPMVLFAADVHVYLPLKADFNGPVETGEEFVVDAKAVANTALGVELLPWEKVGFRMGFYTNLSAARDVPHYLTTIQDRVHMFGGSAAVFFPKKTGSISIGGFVQGGQGSIAELSDTLNSVPRSNFIYGFVVASSYRF